jgi:raffinose/stachyose/melibiose transport system permease protein
MRSKAYPTYFAAGAVLLFAVFYLVPSILGILYSFTDWNSFTTKLNFVGLDNFVAIFSGTKSYLRFIVNTLLFTGATVILKTVIALGLAILLTSGVRRFSYGYRAVMYLPAVLPILVVALIFKSVLNPKTGLLNGALTFFGLDFLTQKWLTEPDIALWSVVGVDVWRGVGYIMVILIAGLLAIPRDYYEASSIDGATWWQSFRHITLPLLRPVLAVTTVLNLLYGLKVFDIVFVLTNGGPGRATDTVYTAVFQDFSKGKYGVATALSTVLFLVMLVVGWFTIKALSGPEENDR